MADGEPVTGDQEVAGQELTEDGQPSPSGGGLRDFYVHHKMATLIILGVTLLLTAYMVFQASKNNKNTAAQDQSTPASAQPDNSGALAAAINALLNYLNNQQQPKQPPPPAPPAPNPPPPPVPPVPGPPHPQPPGPPMPPIPISPGQGPPGRNPPPPIPPVPPVPGRKPPPGRQPPPGRFASPVGQPTAPLGAPPPGASRGWVPTGPMVLPGQVSQGGTGLGNTSFAGDYPVVAQWSPDTAPIQQSMSNIGQTAPDVVTRIESLFSNLFGAYNGPGGVAVPYPGPEPTGFPRSPWQPVPGPPPGPVPIQLLPPVAPGMGPPSGAPPVAPGQGPPRGRFPRMPWQPV